MTRYRTTGRACALLVALALALAGCGGEEDGDAPVDRGAGAERAVLVVSVDGLNPQAIRRLGPERTPALHRLLEEGAGTLNARTAVEQTDTLPNHISMMTGLRIEPPLGHGVTFNDDDGSTVPDHAGGYVRSIFDVAHDAGLSTALLAAKDKFVLVDRTWDGEHGAADRLGEDDGRDKIDVFERHSAASLAKTTVSLLQDGPPDLTFLHLAPPDAAGHLEGFMSAAYLEAVVETDGYVAKLLDTISADPGLSDSMVVILTSDHGGSGPSHRNPHRRQDYTIPFVAWGADVEPGADLYELNPLRREPGTGRPGYAGAQPVRNLDVAPLALDLLGLPTIGEYADTPLAVS